MKITARKLPSKMVFCGNPVEIEVQTDVPGQVDMDVSLDGLYLSEKQTLSFYTYNQDGRNIARIDISDIINSGYDKLEMITLTQEEIIAPIRDYLFECMIEINGGEITYTFIPFRGGISAWAADTLARYGKDMFTYRLNNPMYQWLFTTRTNGRNIVLKETELYFFAFIHPHLPISFITRNNRVITQPPTGSDDIFCSLDIVYLRKMFFELYNELPSYITVHISGNYVFSITITDSLISEDKFLLRFRNSLGWYEMIEVTGQATQKAEFGEENLYMSYDARYNTFVNKRNQVNVQESVEAETGYKSAEELNFLLDMLRSPEIYFLTGEEIIAGSPRERRCIVTCEKYDIPRRITSPQSLKLKIQFIESDQYQTPQIDMTLPEERPFENITAPGRPQLNGVGILYGDETALYGE